MRSAPFDIDSYDDEYDQFQRDVYLLIVGTLNASKKYLDRECESDLAKVKAAMDKTDDPDHHFYIQEEYGDVLMTNISQGRFLRNMALVALASRLTHSLRNMSKSAESFNPRTKEHKKRYKKTHLTEFQRLWLEYSERFGIDFVVHKDRILFADVMNDVRNQIVHEGAEAQPFRFLYEFDANEPNPQYMDTSFAEKYPGYVTEDGSEVTVSEEQLQSFIESSVKLVEWLASELRTRELEHIKAEGMSPQ
jgi:hypothetical protein